MLTVLYDGWPLVARPNRAAGLHLAALLAHTPRQVQAVVALPSEPFEPLPPGVQARVIPTALDERGQIAWAQVRLPALARQLGAGLIHLTGGGQALFASPNSVLSPCELPAEDAWPQETPAPPRPAGLAARLRTSLEQGGQGRLRAIFWPADLPAPDRPNRLVRLPPLLPPLFFPGAPVPPPESDFPDDYVLAHLQGASGELQRILAIWQRVEAALGGSHALVIAAAEPGGPRDFVHLCEQYGLDCDSVRLAPNLGLDELASLYHHCAALLYPTGAPAWGSALRLALAAGRAVVGLETPRSDALLGPAAYLAPPGEGALRVLAAALITVLVDENVAEGLKTAARQRSQSWGSGGQAEALWAAYQAALEQR